MNITEILMAIVKIWKKLDPDTIAKIVAKVSHAIDDLKHVWQFVLDVLEEFKPDPPDVTPDVYADISFETKAAKFAVSHPRVAELCQAGTKPNLIGAGPFLELIRFIIENRQAIMEIVEYVKEIIELFSNDKTE
jgi:hypothetical protein